jgi:hypothetical protein
MRTEGFNRTNSPPNKTALCGEHPLSSALLLFGGPHNRYNRRTDSIG